MPDFFEENKKKVASAYVHLEGLAKSFSLMCSSLQSGISWTRGLVSCIPKVFLSSAHGDHILTLGPHFLIEMMILRVSMNVNGELFIKGFRLMFLPFKTNLI